MNTWEQINRYTSINLVFLSYIQLLQPLWPVPMIDIDHEILLEKVEQVWSDWPGIWLVYILLGKFLKNLHDRWHFLWGKRSNFRSSSSFLSWFTLMICLFLLQKSHVSMYADNTAISLSSNSTDDQ